MNLAVLMTCHNRREKTLRGLRLLVQASEKCEVRNEKLRIEVFLVDDGSTDGTSDAVQEWANTTTSHSSFFILHLIHGSGSLFWARGMALAWRTALHSSTSTPNFNYYLWLNDDVELFPDSLSTLLHFYTVNPNAVLIGECCDPADHTKKTYGMQGRWFNGNFVLVPQCVCDTIGIIDEAYSHARADFDYAERVRCAGVPVVAIDGFVGTCADDWAAKMQGVSLADRLGMLWRPGYWNLRDLWRFQSRYYGKLRALLCCLKLIAIVTR